MMKKLVVSVFAFCSLSFGISVGGFELSPEVGAGVQKVSTNGSSRYDWSAHARLWVGVSNFIVAPQFKYTSINDGLQSLKNTQAGVSAGYKLRFSGAFSHALCGLKLLKFRQILR